MLHTNKFLGALLLIAGTSIGAGILALPASTAPYGFLPAALLFFTCWAVMIYSALLIMEITHWTKPDSNLITMASETLGSWGKAFAWISYLLLLYCLMAAYLGGMNSLITITAETFLHQHIYPWAGSITLIVIFGIIIYLGPRPIDYINRLLVIGLVLSYGAIVFLATPHIKTTNLSHIHFPNLWMALPIIITAFGFHIIIPSLRTYLKDDIKHLKKAIVVGSILTLLIYLAWEAIIMGVIPAKGTHGLIAMLKSGQPAIDITRSLHTIIGNPWLDEISKFLAFFMISTSFIGVSFSLFDFLSDGLHIKKTKLGRFSTALITFIPPLLFMLLYPRGFIIALGYAGVFVAVLLIILPALMAWSGRYIKKIHTNYHTRGGKPALIFITLFAIVIIFAELANKLYAAL